MFDPLILLYGVMEWAKSGVSSRCSRLRVHVKPPTNQVHARKFPAQISPSVRDTHVTTIPSGPGTAGTAGLGGLGATIVGVGWRKEMFLGIFSAL